MREINSKFKTPIPPTDAKLLTDDRIKRAVLANNPKEYHNAVKAKMNVQNSHIVKGIEGVPPDQTDTTITRKYL